MFWKFSGVFRVIKTRRWSVGNHGVFKHFSQHNWTAPNSHFDISRKRSVVALSAKKRFFLWKFLRVSTIFSMSQECPKLGFFKNASIDQSWLPKFFCNICSKLFSKDVTNLRVSVVCFFFICGGNEGFKRH